MRCYHPELHAAEISCARELARLAAAPPLNVSMDRVNQWIGIEEKRSESSSFLHWTSQTPFTPLHVLNGRVLELVNGCFGTLEEISPPLCSLLAESARFQESH